MTPSDFIDSLNLPTDPSEKAPYPRGLSLDLVLEVGTLQEILDSYHLAPEQFKKILANPAFRKEYDTLREEMQTEGWSFRKKAASQAELYLNMVYRMASSDQTPAAVRASLIQSTVKWAGLDNPAASVGKGAPESLADMAQLVKAMSDGELEMRVMQLVLKRTPKPPAPEGITYDAE
jgi:hypothetical protein